MDWAREKRREDEAENGRWTKGCGPAQDGGLLGRCNAAEAGRQAGKQASLHCISHTLSCQSRCTAQEQQQARPYVAIPGTPESQTQAQQQARTTRRLHLRLGAAVAMYLCVKDLIPYPPKLSSSTPLSWSDERPGAATPWNTIGRKAKAGQDRRGQLLLHCASICHKGRHSGGGHDG